MVKLAILLVIAAATFACVQFGLPAFSVVMACLVCFGFALTAAIAGTLVLTNKYQINYEDAFTRSFQGGVALSATIIVGWTAVLNLIAGGITAGLVQHLWDVSVNCAVGTGVIFAVTVVSWAALVFGRRKSNR